MEDGTNSVSGNVRVRDDEVVLAPLGGHKLLPAHIALFLPLSDDEDIFVGDAPTNVAELVDNPFTKCITSHEEQQNNGDEDQMGIHVEGRHSLGCSCELVISFERFVDLAAMQRIHQRVAATLEPQKRVEDLRSFESH